MGKEQTLTREEEAVWINPPSTRDGDGGFIAGDFKSTVISIFTVDFAVLI